MVIYLPGEPRETQVAPEPSFDELTPREIVVELDKYIVGQAAAKRAVAIALRNRVRRQKLTPEMAEDVLPKNILMIGPTGVGKTEIARRLARLAGCPFVKVEASKYTEVGYVGRDVESMVRDLVETSIDMVREEKLDEVAERAEQAAEERVLDLLLPASPRRLAPSLTVRLPLLLPRSRRNQIAGIKPTAPGKTARSFETANSISAWWKWKFASASMPAFEIISNQGVRGNGCRHRATCCRACLANRRSAAK